MRRLRSALLIALLCLVLPGACRPREKIRLEPTEENLNLLEEVSMADPRAGQQLIRGFHALEQNAWRWTMREFSVLLRPPANQSGLRLHAEVSVPEAVILRLGSVTLTAQLGGSKLGSTTWKAAGEHTFTADIPPGLVGTEPVTVDFSLDRFLAAGTADERELGIIVSSVGLRSR